MLVDSFCLFFCCLDPVSLHILNSTIFGVLFWDFQCSLFWLEKMFAMRLLSFWILKKLCCEEEHFHSNHATTQYSDFFFSFKRNCDDITEFVPTSCICRDNNVDRIACSLLDVFRNKSILFYACPDNSIRRNAVTRWWRRWRWRCGRSDGGCWS